MSINKGFEERAEASIAIWAREQDAQHIAKLREEIALTHLRHDFGTDGSQFLLKRYAATPESRSALLEGVLKQRATMTLDPQKSRELNLEALGVSKADIAHANELFAHQIQVAQEIASAPATAGVSSKAVEGTVESRDLGQNK